MRARRTPIREVIQSGAFVFPITTEGYGHEDVTTEESTATQDENPAARSGDRDRRNPCGQ
ncbi:MAG: hypothetical protein IT410_01550 [Candidatus Doudnabacteria bacterium]|nr:hypothetical protein [Candidatus Doudnabacteria bacterium]